MNLPFPIVVLDFETFFDKEYSLKKLTTEHYVRHARFRAHGCAIRFPGTQQTSWFEARDLHDVFGVLQRNEVAILCHHAQFDGLILSHHYGIRPRMWLDTMAMGRALLSSHLSVSLDSLAKMFGLSAKTVPYKEMEGKQWEQMDAQLRQSVAAGAIHDVNLTWDIFCKLAPSLPAEEFALIDQTVRMFTEPQLVGNTARLSELFSAELERKQALLSKLGVTGVQLRSDGTFATLLENEGVEIEYKEGKNGPIPAFAKSDDFMRRLLDDENPQVAALAAARLSEGSSIVQTRSARLRDMSERGSMCVYLNYCGAHTKRFSGGDKLNWQNSPRNSELGAAVGAVEGASVIVSDASQIECRFLNQMAGQLDVVEMFRRKEDIYCHRASQFYGFTVTKEHPAERGTGKQLELSCGYGAGGPTIVSTAAKGTYGPPVQLSQGQGLQARDLYRSTHPFVVWFWREADEVLGRLAAGQSFTWRDILQVRDKKIYGPNGLALDYSTLEWASWQKKDGSSETGWRLWINDNGRKHWTKMYGAKCIENVIQFIARIHTTQAWLRCARAGMHMVSMEHDKLIAVVRENEADAALAYMEQELRRPPEWMPGVPLDSEGYVSRTMKK